MATELSIPAETVKALLGQAGISGAILDSVRLGGGGNNRAYRLDTEAGPVLLKEYFRHPEDPRDRAGAEYAFLSFCRECNIARVPLPLAILPDRGIALYSWVEGEPLVPGTVTDEDVAEAAAFTGDLARVSHSQTARKLPPATDACFSIQEHLDRIEARLHDLQNVLSQKLRAGADDLDREASSFVNGCLAPTWRAVRSDIETATSEAIRLERLNFDSCIVSPSDFGFHNALRTAGGLVFLDFEYAGLDDPAKLLCDFACQPAVPVHMSAVDQVQTVLARIFCVTGEISLPYRATLLLPAHRLKWCCIMLNEFKHTDAERRRFSGRLASMENRHLQLKKVIDVMASFFE